MCSGTRRQMILSMITREFRLLTEWRSYQTNSSPWVSHLALFIESLGAHFIISWNSIFSSEELDGSHSDGIDGGWLYAFALHTITMIVDKWNTVRNFWSILHELPSYFVTKNCILQSDVICTSWNRSFLWNQDAMQACDANYVDVDANNTECLEDITEIDAVRRDNP